MATAVHVKRDDISTVETRDTALPVLADDGVRLKIDSFSVTANNVTYAAIGDMFGYWNFFPTDREGFGIVPMWGHAKVEASNHPDIAVGERLYGYLPMGSHLDILPGNISAGMVSDMAAHRQPMSPFYNQYRRLAADPSHDPAREDARMLFEPLFMTSFLIEAMFNRAAWHGAQQVIMTSASSKTALALAHVAREKSPQIKRVGLTSSSNLEFVRDTGLYDQVLGYGAISGISMQSSVSVDFAGNASVLAGIHGQLGDLLAYSCLVGATHVDARGQGGGAALPGPAPILFFAPDYATAMIKEVGPAAFGAGVAESWKSFVAATDALLTVDHRSGLDAAADAFVQTVKGNMRPDLGIVIRL
jgi:Protein of unknown function (DUF2855)